MHKITLLIFISCTKNKKDMSLYYNNHLNDLAHIDNTEIRKQKDQVFELIVNFDKWYRDNFQKIIFYEGNEFWNINYYQDKDEKMRLNILKEKVIPSISDCSFITNNLKNKALNNSRLEDPKSLGFMLSGDFLGQGLSALTFYQNSSEYSKFNRREFLDSDRLNSEWDESPQRVINQEEALFYHLTMIKLVDNDKAIYRGHTGMSDSYTNNYGYLIQ